MNPQALARPNIARMKRYQSARLITEVSDDPFTLLDANESPAAPETKQALRWNLNRYPSPQPKILREKLASLYGVDLEQILISRGSDDLIDALIRTFCEPGADSILITPPTYGIYEIYANIQGISTIGSPLNQSFEIDLDDLIKKLEERPKLTVLCRPNNPIGNLYPESTILEIADKVGKQGLVVVDEAYIEFSSQASLAKRVKSTPNLVVLRTLSKAWGLAGARLGSIIASPEINELLRKVLAPYPVSTPTLEAVIETLDQWGEAGMKANVESILSEKKRMTTELGDLSFVEETIPSETNFFLIRVKQPDVLMKACRAKNLILRDRSMISGLDRCVRVSVGSKDENSRLIEIVKELS